MTTKMDKLIIGILLAFTAIGTAGLVDITTQAQGLTLVIRQLAAVGFTDGIILYWHKRQGEYKDTKQRTWAGRMLWASVAVVLLFTMIYGGLSVTASNEWMNTITKPLIVAGMELFAGTPAEMVSLFVTVVIGLQAAGTLAAILYISQIDPETLKAIAQKEAEEAIAKQQQSDYRTAQKAIAPVVGTAQALAALRTQLTAMGYNERERERMVSLAAREIQAGKADAETVTPNSHTMPPVVSPALWNGVTMPPMVTPTSGGEVVPEAIPFRSNGNGHKK